MNKQNTAEGRATVGMKCYSCFLGKTSAEESCNVSMHNKTPINILAEIIFQKNL